MNAPTAHTHAPHFVDREQRLVADHLGMWTFLATEILFFGGLITCYTVYRWAYPEAFAQGSAKLDFWIGTINTAVLLTSSLLVALGDHAIKAGAVRTLRACIIGAMALGVVFLALKGHEYALKFHEHLVPGSQFHVDEPHAPQVQLFMFLYFALTGLHAAHMIAGIAAMTWLLWTIHRGRVTAEEHAPVSIVGLYWHFVDVVWVFLYPMLYLIR
jgi:cytochrome c oxidase subunit 3